MVRPVQPRDDYTREIRTLTTLRSVVSADVARSPEWKREGQARIDALIRHLTEPPTPRPPRAG